VTSSEAVFHIRDLLEARGGEWPKGFELVAVQVVRRHSEQFWRQGSAMRRVLEAMEARGGSYHGRLDDLANELGMARETLSRQLIRLGAKREECLMACGIKACRGIVRHVSLPEDYSPRGTT